MASGQEGANLGPYRIIEQVGLGGMATVYNEAGPPGPVIAGTGIRVTDVVASHLYRVHNPDE